MRATRAAGRGGGLSAQRISDWRKGRNVPSRFETFEPVLVTLIQLARAGSVPLRSPLSNRQAWKRLWQAATEEPLSSRPTVTTGLRRDIDTFVGRELELHRILQAAGPGRVVSIHTVDGMPGVGKTALVVRGAHLLSDQFPDGRFFVELHAHTPGQTPADPFDVLATLLTELGVAPGHIPDSLAARCDLWRDRLSHRRALLVLDDARDRAQIEPLLPTGPDCLTLITSRRRLVALDGAVPLTLDALDPDHAAELFALLAQRVPGGSADAAAIAEIVRLCGCLPLAIVLLAGRLAHHPSWTIQSLADRFAAATDRLTELDTGDRAVYAAFTMSYRDLPPERARLFRYLGLHPGPDTDASAVAALADLPVAVARRELEALYTDHLIEEPTSGRYRLHDLLRDYARILVASNPTEENDRALGRLLDYYRSSAAAADRHLARHTRPVLASAPASVTPREFGDEVQALTWMRVERANLLICLETVATERPGWMVELTGALAGLLDRDGPWSQARHLHRRAAVVARSLGDRLGEATALADLGSVCERAGDYAEAVAQQQQALVLYREVGNHLGEANTLGNLGLVHYRTGNHAEARDLYQQAVARYRDIGDRRGQAGALNNLGLACEDTGDYAEAGHLFQRALALYQEIGDRRGQANALGNLGLVREDTGNYDEAINLQQRALTLFREIGDRRGEANTLMNLGTARYRTEDYAEAARLHQSAVDLHREIGNRLGEAEAIISLGDVRFRTGDYAEAATLYQWTLALFREIGARFGEAEALNAIGRVLIERGELRDALKSFTEALELAGRIHSQLEQAHALEGAGRCHAGLGDTVTGVTQLREAVEIYRRLGGPEAAPASAYLAALEHTPSS